MSETRAQGNLYGLLAICASVYLYIFVRVLWHVGDEGLFVHGAAMVAAGAVPYRDFFETVGPGPFYWLGFFFRLFGTSLFVARGLVLLTGTSTALLIYWLTRRLYRGPFEILPALGYLVLAFSVWPVTNHHWESNLFGLLCLVATVSWQERGQDSLLLFAGVLAGLTSCFLQQKGLLLFLAVLMVVSIGRRSDSRRVVRSLGLVTAGYSAVIAAVVGFFFLADGLSELIYDTLIWPLVNYTEVNNVPYGFGLFEGLHALSWRPLLEARLSPPAPTLLAGVFAVPYGIIVLLPLLCLAAAGLVARNRHARERVLGVRTWPYWSTGTVMWVSELHRSDVFHLIYGAPVLIIMLFVAWSTWSETRPRLRWATLGAVTLCIVAVGAFHGSVALSATHQIETRRGRIQAFKEDEALSFLLEELRPGERVFIYPYYSMYYFLADLENPTKYSIMLHNFNTVSEFTEVVDDLERLRVEWVLEDSRFDGLGPRTWFPKYSKPVEEAMVLERYLEREYEVTGIANGFRILRRRSDP